MRIWSLHPNLLDTKGLVALWRETLLAKHVLEGKTKGYRHHPQLRRFQEHPKLLAAINSYLFLVWEEASARGYSFDKTKIGKARTKTLITITDGQLFYEWKHFLAKAKARDKEHYARVRSATPRASPVFAVTTGDVAGWEVQKPEKRAREA